MLVFATCFIILKITASIEGANPRSVNLELETVLAFDNKDNIANVQLIDDVQNFLTKVKEAVNNKTPQRRSFGTVNNNKNNNNINKNLKFIDFVKKLVKVLKNYQNDDLEDVFAVIDDEVRKYHYKGCKFYELVENNNLRRSVARVLDIVKEKPASVIRSNLDTTLQLLDNTKFDSKQTEILDYINTLYTKEDGFEFNKILENFQTYQSKSKRANIEIINLVRDSLRTAIFDHYTRLNKNIRNDLKEKLDTFYSNFNKQREINHKLWTIGYENTGKDKAKNLREGNIRTTPLEKNEFIDVLMDENLEKPIKSVKKKKHKKKINTNKKGSQETIVQNNENIFGREQWFSQEVSTPTDKIRNDDSDDKSTDLREPNISDKADNRDRKDIDGNNSRYQTKNKKRPKKDDSSKNDGSSTETETTIKSKRSKKTRLTTPLSTSLSTPLSIKANIKEFIRNFKINFSPFQNYNDNVGRSKKKAKHDNDEMSEIVTSYSEATKAKPKEMKRVKVDATTESRLHTLWEEKVKSKKHHRKNRSKKNKNVTKNVHTEISIESIHHSGNTPENEFGSESKNQNKHTAHSKLRKSKKKSKHTSRSKTKRRGNAIKKKKKGKVSKFESTEDKETEFKSLYLGGSEQRRSLKKQRKTTNDQAKKSTDKKKSDRETHDTTDETAEELDTNTKRHVNQASTEEKSSAESIERHKKITKHVYPKKHHKTKRRKVKKKSSKKTTPKISTKEEVYTSVEEEHTPRKGHKTEDENTKSSFEKSLASSITSAKSTYIKPPINELEDITNNNKYMKASHNSQDETIPSNSPTISEEGMSIESNEAKKEINKIFIKQPIDFKTTDSRIDLETEKRFEKTRRHNNNYKSDIEARFNPSDHLEEQSGSAEKNKPIAYSNKISDVNNNTKPAKTSMNRIDIFYKQDMKDISEKIKKSLKNLSSIVSTDSNKIEEYSDLLRNAGNNVELAKALLDRIDFFDKHEVKMASEEIEKSFRKMRSLVNFTKKPESRLDNTNFYKNTALSIESNKFNEHVNQINDSKYHTKPAESFLTQITPVDRPVMRTEKDVLEKSLTKIIDFDKSTVRTESALNQAGTLEKPKEAANDNEMYKSKNITQSSTTKIVTKYPLLDFWQSTKETTKIKQQSEERISSSITTTSTSGTTFKTTLKELTTVTKNDNTILNYTNSSNNKQGNKRRKKKKKKKAKTSTSEAVTLTTSITMKKTNHSNQTYNNETNDTALINKPDTVRTKLGEPININNKLDSNPENQNANFTSARRQNVNMTGITPNENTPTESDDQIMQSLLDKYDIATVAVNKHYDLQNIQSALESTKTDMRSQLKEEDSKVRVNRDLMNLFGHTVTHPVIHTVPANTLFTDPFASLDLQ